MLRAKIGCCCGCIIGCSSVFVLLFALVFGVYCWFCPEVWERTVNRVESIWDMFKDEGDRLVESVPRKNETGDPVPPEPEVKRE